MTSGGEGGGGGWIHTHAPHSPCPLPQSGDELPTAGIPYLAGLVHGACGHYRPLIVEQGTGYLSSVANQSVHTSVGMTLPLPPLIGCGCASYIPPSLCVPYGGSVVERASDQLRACAVELHTYHLSRVALGSPDSRRDG